MTMELFGAFSGIVVAGFLILVAILSLLLPFFVFTIRNEIVSMNKKLGVLIQVVNDTKNPSDNKPSPTNNPIVSSNSTKCYLCNKTFPIEELSERGGSMFCGPCIKNINPDLIS